MKVLKKEQILEYVYIAFHKVTILEIGFVQNIQMVGKMKHCILMKLDLRATKSLVLACISFIAF